MAVQVKSFQQLVGQMARRLMAVTGMNDVNKGSVLLTFLEAAAQNDFEQMAAMIQLLDDFSVDNTSGADLDKRAVEYGLLQGRKTATFASGYVNLSDSTVTKVSTKIYVGANAPIVGDVAIKVDSSTNFAGGNQIYIGRGTPNEEGPITISSVSVGTAFSTLNLSSALTKNHNGAESVIKAQGGARAISKGTKVQIPANNVSAEVSFTVQTDATIADGESLVQNILVKADKPGTTGNAPLGAISAFVTSPFTGASVSNPTAFSNATDLESDEDLRARIKQHIQSLAKGVAEAIKSGVVGTFDEDDSKRVVSASLLEPTTTDDFAKLYIDDGTGFEPSFIGRGEETLVDDAGGTEKFLQLGQYPITKAQVVSANEHPYDFTDGGTFTVKVDGVSESIDFNASDFDIEDGATAIEVAKVINDRAVLVSARTADGQKSVVLFPKAEANRIQVVSSDVNDILGFPTEEVHTLRIYKNDTLLSHDGTTASTESIGFSQWAGVVESSILAIDVNDKPRQWIRLQSDSIEVALGQGSAPGTFVALTNATSFLDLGVTITVASPSQWATVLNQAINGATFSVNQDRLVLTSLVEKSADSKVRVLPVSDAPTANLASAMGWDTTAKVGRANDYSLNRFSGQIELAAQLAADDRVLAGTTNTRGFKHSAAANPDFNLSQNSASRKARIYVVVDGDVTIRTVAITPGITTITATRPGGSTTRYTANGAIFGTSTNAVAVGDYVIISRSEDANQGVFRVTAVEGATPANWIEVENPTGSAGAAQTQSAKADVHIFSSSVPPQKVEFTDSANTTVTSAVTQINEQITGATASVDGTKVKIVTNRYKDGGSIQIPASVEWASSRRLDFTSAAIENNTPHVAALESQSELGTPVALGKGSVTTADTDGVDPVTITDSARTGSTPGSDSQWVKWLSGNNKGLRLFVKSYDSASPTSVPCRDSSYTALGSARLIAPDMLHHTTVGDLYQQMATFEFDQDDSLVAIVDGDELAKTYTVPLYRNGRCTSAGAATFSGLDLDGAAASTFAGTLWNTYDFTDYKVWFKAHKVINPTGANNAFIVRSVKYGPLGEKIRFALGYPTAPSTAISASVTPSKTSTDVMIRFGSGAARTSGWDATTRFDITLGAGTIIYTYDGTGTAPAFVANGVVVGDIATINSANFNTANNGTFYVSAVTATTLTVLGTGFAEVDKTLGVQSALKIYPLATNTATDVVSKVNSDTVASKLIDATLAVGQSGAGTIAQSTADDAGITDDSAGWVSLVDGENWVLSYQNPGAPSFTLKNNLAQLSVTDGSEIYNFGTAPNKDGTTGEYFKLIPVTTRHLVDHFNKKAITGLSVNTLVQRSNEGDKIQIASLVAGSSGSVHVSGGPGNAITTPITKIAAVDGTSTKLTVSTAQAYGLFSGATLKVENAVAAKCINTFDSATVTALTLPSVYNATMAKIELQERSPFGLAGASVSVTGNADGTAVYTITAGAGSFASAQVGDELFIPTTLNFANAVNEGSFPVTASTATTITVINPAAITEGAVVLNADQNKIKAVVPLFYHPKSPVVGCIMAVEKLNDRFVRIRYKSGGTAPVFSKSGVKEGFWVDISSPFNSSNTGRFRIIAVDDTSFIIENANAVDETTVTCVAEIIDAEGESTGGSLRFWGPNSAIKNGKFFIGELTATGWFASKFTGTHTINGQGRYPQTGANTDGRHFVYITRSALMDTQTTITLGSNTGSFFAIELEVFSAYRSVENASINPLDTTESYVWISGDLNSDRWSALNGTSLKAANKLGFSTTKKVGNDGYVYWTGLLRKVHRIIDGYDPDRVTYPGLKATGAWIEVLAPEIERVKIALDVNTVSGLSVTAISDTIKSTVLSYISSLGVGEDVIMSEVIKRVQDIAGVESVVLVDPDPDTERITIQDSEKAISFESDITVT